MDFLRITVAVILGGIGAAAGFTHTHEWASHHGQTGWLAWATAVVIEGMVVVAGFEVQRDHRHGHTGRITFPMTVLVAGFGVQMAAQVALAEPSPAGWLVAAMPALGFLVVVKLLMRRTPTSPATSTPEPAPAPAPVPAMPGESKPTTPTAPDTTAEPSEQITAPEPVKSPRLRLPAPLTARLDDLAEQARRDGRQLTAADIRQAVKVPEDMALRILADLTPRNGHTVTGG
ncbi:DUF2637 domain-containing protein [Prauserella cavernicola]|uniref:DUF2637 domain-containing protein n=1 Tax=Prauserella cavernicola TaxID=2800127 RepID=UPI0027DBFDFF|nr:DUF2637 domain-containing protein [Prauserella cavernicola]